MSGLIVFDFDNTLVHSKIDFLGIRRELLELLRQAGHPEAYGEAEGLMRLSIGQIIASGTAHAPDIHDEAWRIVVEYETAGMIAATIEPNAVETLHALRDHGFSLTVLTNNARPATLAALDLFAMSSAFDLVLTRDEAAMKPDPAGIRIAMERLAVGRDRTVMVGDSWMDGAAAARAGVQYVGFQARPTVLAERGVAYWAVVEHLTDLMPLLTGPWPTEAAGGAS
ncbi:MAG: HAD family hydrolase [Chloroflexi bacterium]|nr:HAD family hydrolase [Chloroflexota bacterium]